MNRFQDTRSFVTAYSSQCRHLYISTQLNTALDIAVDRFDRAQDVCWARSTTTILVYDIYVQECHPDKIFMSQELFGP